ncbi:MAG: plastocyanin/azurin family copper-binding protein [Dehalococcoidia bacterium]
MRRGFTTRSVWLAIAGSLLAAALLASCGDSADDEAAMAAATVTSGPRTTVMEKNRFETPMRVAVGSTVTWVNEDRIAHNVIAKDGAFKSGTMDEGDTFSHEFTTAGRFEYVCTFHPGMDGVIQVE